jgi:hypothetical protein
VQWSQFIATIVIAVFAVTITYRQWRTAHERVLLDLFEKRMTIYENVRAVIAEITRNGTADGATVLRFVQATDRIGLLFGIEVLAYSDETRERIVQLAYHKAMINGGAAGQFVKDIETHQTKAAELLKALGDFHDEFSVLMMPYVRITTKLRYSR